MIDDFVYSDCRIFEVSERGGSKSMVVHQDAWWLQEEQEETLALS